AIIIRVERGKVWKRCITDSHILRPTLVFSCPRVYLRHSRVDQRRKPPRARSQVRHFPHVLDATPVLGLQSTSVSARRHFPPCTCSWCGELALTKWIILP